MELRNSIGFISRMNPLIISMGKISFLDPIIQYSTIPLFQLHVVKLMGHPSGVKPMPGPLGMDSFFSRCLHNPRSENLSARLKAD